ncbi:hypothetical protein MGYG_08414 [Nannizzia gypsea CBS 118893]|uniref:Uncharacterized protein n=1 Tax=Arthroderma gypseum (strain ATCC MYA-4604 / CBS 118893) TaxID=535722 RepID=E4V5M7_ARTGP|nr:hypothetical protein MGYG_08414 [Nannizzia gypsea CBS 118893]EFR05402.1 hypothetical protein MGYG_08414 [Nannizzia gypsea CBS 118893]
MSWVRCCLDRPILKRRSQKTSGPLDERFGDPSISGPMEGGWNQISPSPDAKERGFQSANGTSEQTARNTGGDLVRTRSKPWRCSPRGFGSRTNTELMDSSKSPKEDTSTAKDKADFVYKPASGDFLKTMAELGKPKNGRYSSEMAPSVVNNRHTSLQSNSSLEPTLPGEIPRHPFHQDFSTRSQSPANRTYSNKSSSPTEHYFDQRASATNHSASARNSSARDEDCSSYTTPMDVEKSPRSIISDTVPVPTYLPSNPAPSEQNRRKRKTKPKRVVTSEMVPSTNDLFG